MRKIKTIISLKKMIFVLTYDFLLIWIVYSACQSLGTDCKDLIAMIKDIYVWPSFATELKG